MDRVLRYLTAGESHGQGLVVIIEGLPAGLDVTVEAIGEELARRRLGYGRGPRMRFEHDELTLLGGVRHGRTLGSPVAIEIANTEWPKWVEEMSPAPGQTEKPLTKARPGHADLPGMQKYGFDDARDVLERASARETAARVAAGAVAKALLAATRHQRPQPCGGHGPGRSPRRTAAPSPDDRDAIDASEVRCFDPDAEAAMVAEIKAAAKVGDSARRGRRGHRLRGPGRPREPRPLGPQARRRPGRRPHEHPGGQGGRDRRRLRRRHPPRLRRPRPDRLGRRDGGPTSGRPTGAEASKGGMSNGEPVVARVAMKPLATLNRPVLKTVDVVTKEETVSFKERTDVTAVPAMGVVAETMMALVLAKAALRKFGGDSVDRDAPQLRVLRRRPDVITDDRPRVLLIGMMGAGKSTVGRPWPSAWAGATSTATRRSSLGEG